MSESQTVPSRPPSAVPSAAATRRDFIATAGKVTAGSALAATALPQVHAQASANDAVRVALVGCGGRGSGAAANALSVKGQVNLVAMADVFTDRLNSSHRQLADRYKDKVDVPEDRRFIGFDAYREAIDAVGEGGVAIFATPPAFRWVHFAYAVERGVNVFMEKPVTVDGPSTRRMLALGEASVKKGLKVGVGLMCRHCEARGELYQRIRDGEIGEITLLRAYRMHGPVGSAFSGPCPEGTNELEYQIRRFHSFLWASGGCYSDFYIHNIDESCWMKDAWPVEAQALGGRHYRGGNVDQNFDSYAIEYTFADGAKLQFSGRTMLGCHNEFASYAHGTKNSAVISSASHSPARCRIMEGQKLKAGGKALWAFRRREPNPYQLEWDHLVDAIRNNKPHNEVKRGAEASLVTSMGRMAAHTGQKVTYEQILNSEHEFAPGVADLKLGGEAPLASDPEGRYPLPQPGKTRDREY